jgi:hypothetical protein
MADDTSIDVLETAWFSIRDNFDDLQSAIGAGSGPDQEKAQRRERLAKDRDAARDAYYDAIAKAFDEANGDVKQAKAALSSAASQMKQALSDLKDLVTALGLVSSVVRLAGALAALAV